MKRRRSQELSESQWQRLSVSPKRGVESTETPCPMPEILERAFAACIFGMAANAVSSFRDTKLAHENLHSDLPKQSTS